MACGDLINVAAMTTPCSVNTRGRCRAPPQSELEVANCDLKMPYDQQTANIYLDRDKAHTLKHLLHSTPRPNRRLERQRCQFLGRHARLDRGECVIEAGGGADLAR